MMFRRLQKQLHDTELGTGSGTTGTRTCTYVQVQWGYNPDIVFMNRIDHDFTHFYDDDMAYMQSIKERLFTIPLGTDVGEFFIQNVARGLAGDVMKRILFGLGMSNTGKGIFTKACQLSLGQYCGSFTAENLAYNNNSGDEAQKMRWVYLLRHKRLAISNEITNNRPLNSNLIKKICSGGDALQGRVHGGLETEFIPQFLSIFLANDLPPIKPYDEPMQKRAKVINHTKSFVDNPSNEFELQKDSNLDKEMTTLRFRRCFVGLLIKSYLDFQMGGRVENEPEEVNAAKAVWLGSDDENNIIAKFLEKYEITDNKDDFVKSSEIENWTVVNKDISYRKFCQELKKYCTIHKHSNVEIKQRKVNKVNVQGWFGLRLIEGESNESLCVIEDV
jgi:phage/plasmid-associated DNA primase